MVPDTLIYAIADAGGAVHYVGRTRHTLIKRLRSHLYARTKIGNWVRANKESVSVLILERLIWSCAEGAVHHGLRERYWIEHYRKEGAPLLNEWPRLKPEHPATDRANFEAEHAS